MQGTIIYSTMVAYLIDVFFQITLKLEGIFKRSITYVAKNDSDLGDQVAAFGRAHEFGDITWYPSQHKAVYRVDDRVPINASGNGLYDFTPFRSTPSLVLAVLRTTGFPTLYSIHVHKLFIIHYNYLRQCNCRVTLFIFS